MPERNFTHLFILFPSSLLKLMRSLKECLGMATMLITHDLGVIIEMAERVVVMYTGIKMLFSNPMHPYTWGPRSSIRRVEVDRDRYPPLKSVLVL